MIFPTTNTCPNTPPYPYDGHSWAEYAFYFVIIFKYVSEKNYDTQPIPSVFWSLCMPCSWTALLIQCLRINVLPHTHYRTTVGQWLNTLVPRRYIGMGVQLHGKRGVQNVTLVDFYMKSFVYAEGIGRASKFFSKT
ncbi:hypothetical protein SFRURICE_003921 [Spodoptera frugiperda]|nr:hypothetical protein SFRURICE_003921 [Spodoptera frugiperda]